MGTLASLVSSVTEARRLLRLTSGGCRRGYETRHDNYRYLSRWFRYVDKVQTAINSTYQRNVGTSPFEVLFGVKMRRKEDPDLLSLIELESIAAFNKGRQELRKLAQENITQVQCENRRAYNRRCKPATQYNIGDQVYAVRTRPKDQINILVLTRFPNGKEMTVTR